MKNVVLMSLLVILGITSVDAQYSKKNKERAEFKFGIRAAGGSILSRPELSLVGNENDYVIHEVNFAKATPQFSMGAFAHKKFGWIFSEAAVSYATYGMQYDVRSYIDGNGTVVPMSERFGYMDVQVMAGLTDNGFRLGVGPVAHILVHQDSELTSLTNYFQKFRTSTFGFSALVGYEIGHVSFDLKYDKAFRTLGDHIYYGYRKSQFRETPDALMLQVSYRIN
jgi:hypothetical protein